MSTLRVTCKGAQTLPLDRIEEFQGNLKKLSKKNLEKLKKRIIEDGFNVPFFVWDHEGMYKALDGHQRIKALCSLREEGWDIPLLPVAFIEASDEQDARKKLLAISSQYGEFDSAELSEWLDEIGGEVAETLRLVDSELKIEKEEEEETSGDDEVATVTESVTEPGDIYDLGGGRLICGDSTDQKVLDNLLNGELVDLWLTDPPYNVALGDGGSKDEARKRHRRTDGQIIMNDSQTDEGFHDFLVRAFATAKASMKDGAAFYIWHADNESFNFRGACRDCGLDVRQCLIWNKQAMTLGRQDYQWKHEPCLYGWKEGASHSWYSDRSQTTVLDFNRPSVSKEHPTMKPVDLFSYQVKNSSKEGDLVLDSFGGSGTTLIACEKLNRRARLVELDPHYCDVIVGRYARWCKENGRESNITRNGEPIKVEDFFR